MRQGDLLSPYLFFFILFFCVEGLLALIKNAKSQGSLHGYRVSKGAPSITHLLFENDAFFFLSVEC